MKCTTLCFLWKPYLDAGTFYQAAIQRLYGQLGTFQDFVLYTEIWLQKNQDFLTFAFQAQTARDGARNGAHLNYSGQSHQNGCSCCAGLDSDHRPSILSGIIMVQGLVFRK